MDNKNKLRRRRAIIVYTLIAVYFIGLFLLFFGLFTYGLALWIFSTVLALAFLYRVKAVEEAEAIIEAEKNGENDHADET